MATDLDIYSIPGLLAAADLSDYQYHFVELSASKTVNVASAADANTVGILQDKPEAANRACKVAGPGNISKLVLGSGGATYGNKLTPDSSGHGVVATSAQKYGAMALESGDENDLISVLVENGYVPA